MVATCMQWSLQVCRRSEWGRWPMGLCANAGNRVQTIFKLRCTPAHKCTTVDGLGIKEGTQTIHSKKIVAYQAWTFHFVSFPLHVHLEMSLSWQSCCSTTFDNVHSLDRMSIHVLSCSFSCESTNFPAFRTCQCTQSLLLTSKNCHLMSVSSCDCQTWFLLGFIGKRL